MTGILIKIRNNLKYSKQYNCLTVSSIAYFQLGSTRAYHYDSAAFLYSLVNYPGWQPVKFYQTGLFGNHRRYSIYTRSDRGPTFGGHDIDIADYAASNTNSYSDLGHTYSAPSGHSFGSSFARSFLAGSMDFQPDEIEVFYETT